MLSMLGMVKRRHVIQADKDVVFMDSLGVTQETLIDDVKRDYHKEKGLSPRLYHDNLV